MTTDELRLKFLNFFKSRGHKIYPSDSLIPKDDPTLLFTSAGMNQFKQEFLGQPTKFKRCASCQKCLRTDDLDKVGKTDFHHTFFEMLGNFSFGDYFKQEAIQWAWEFVTEELGLAKERLWVSVYQEDEEAYRIWQDKIGIVAQRIVKLGAKENFWPANAPEEGPNGPCGPCSEIFYDQGEDLGCRRPGCNPGCNCGRFVETWNLVFTQFERVGKNKLVPLPNKNIDTGMGLERMAAVLQGVSSNFEIDIFKPIVKEIAKLASRSPNLRTCYTIADHIRGVTFAIAEGIVPSNDERGYVIRKLIRRAVWQGRSLGIAKPYLYKIVPAVVKTMQAAYPELEKKREDVAQVVLAEEQRFRQSLERASALAEEIIAELKTKGEAKIPGEVAFRLYDTYGLPAEMLEDIVSGQGLELDKQGFAQELELQRLCSRRASGFSESVFVGTLASRFKLKPTNFIGDKKNLQETTISALFKEEELVKEAKGGEDIKVVLDTTPFYGESGGQSGDTGIIKNKAARIEVTDTQRIDQTIVHLGKVLQGVLRLNDRVQAQIDVSRRKNIARNHTATHLLQAALRKVLGEHVRQSGSWVGADKLRFDFTHFQALSKRQLQRVEELVNDEIKQNTKVEVLNMSFAEAEKLGALAFFGEKYQEQVRVVKVGDVSLELCGGTHLESCGEIKLFKIISESSIASGIRRIEAVTAERAKQVLQEEENQFNQLAEAFGGRPEELPERIVGLLQRIKQLNARLDNVRIENFKLGLDKMIQAAHEASGIKIIAQEIKSTEINLLRLMADLLRPKDLPLVIVLASVWEGKALIVCALSVKARLCGLDAVKIICALAKEVDGSGGGRADFAQAGGRKPERLKQVLEKVEQVVKTELDHESN